MNYFGIIDVDKFGLLGKEEKLSYYIKYKLVHKRISLNFGSFPQPDHAGVVEYLIELSEDLMKYVFIKDLGIELASFLLDHYKVYLGADLSVFQREFQHQLFGLTREKQYELGLEYFNKFFNECCDKFDQKLIRLENNKSKLEARFISLKRKQTELYYSLRFEVEIVEQYLIGNLKYFNNQLYHSYEIVRKIFEFENNLQILQYLNDEFKFEIDTPFKKKAIESKIYESYKDCFESFEQVKFIVDQIRSQGKIKHSLVVSIFYFFKTHLFMKMPSAKLFKEIINLYFQCNLGVIKLSDSSNEAHQIRIATLNLKWDEYIV